MGQLVDGVWTADTKDASSSDGEFRRKEKEFRNWITADGRPGPSGEGGFPAASGRYHLYLSYACPWAHRTLIFLNLKGLTDHVGVSVVHPDLLEHGWTFATGFDGATGDRLHGLEYLHQIYTRAAPRFTGRVSVPVLWDTERQTIVSNESSEIIRMFNTAFDAITGNSDDYYPEDLREVIGPINTRVYETVNNGVYRAGFAGSQEHYEKAALAVFDSLQWLDQILSRGRYLAGDRITEADWRLFTTLARFDAVYLTHFKCNRRRVADHPNLWGYARELYQWPGVTETVRPDHFLRHYYCSHTSINPRRIIPINPVLDWSAPHGRGR